LPGSMLCISESLRLLPSLPLLCVIFPSRRCLLKLKDLQDKEKQTLFPQHTLPASNTAQTICPKEINPFNPKEDLHVISHESPTPKPIPNTAQPLNNTIPAARPSSTSNSGGDRHFGPRPLPQVPNGMSRTTPNASLMQGVMPSQPKLLPVQSFTHPSSRMDVVAPAPAPQINPFVPTSRSMPPSEQSSRHFQSNHTLSPINSDPNRHLVLLLHHKKSKLEWSSLSHSTTLSLAKMSAPRSSQLVWLANLVSQLYLILVHSIKEKNPWCRWRWCGEGEKRRTR
jgi:hypothetical protein